MGERNDIITPQRPVVAFKNLTQMWSVSGRAVLERPTVEIKPAGRCSQTPMCDSVCN